MKKMTCASNRSVHLLLRPGSMEANVVSNDKAAAAYQKVGISNCKPKYKSVTYCCVSNCSKNAKSIDPRTGKQVKMHGFPHPQRDKKRCQCWLVNIRRQDLNFRNIKSKKVCSVHFEIGAYSCPSDISSSMLLPSAVPTIISCLNHSKSLSLKQQLPKKRHIVVPKKFKFEDVDFSSADINEIGLSSPTSSEIEKLRAELKRVKQENCKVKKELKLVKRNYCSLLKKYKRALRC